MLGASPSCHITPTTGTYIEYAPTKAIHKNCIVAKAIFQSKLYCCTGKLYCCTVTHHGGDGGDGGGDDDCRRHSSRQRCFAGVAIHSILVMTNITIALWSRARLASGSQMWRHARAAIRRIIQNARKVPPCSIIFPSQTTTWALPGYQSPSTDAESSFHSDLDSVYEVLWEARCEDSVYEVLRGRLEIGG